MTVDVQCEATIPRPRTEVATVAAVTGLDEAVAARLLKPEPTLAQERRQTAHDPAVGD